MSASYLKCDDCGSQNIRRVQLPPTVHTLNVTCKTCGQDKFWTKNIPFGAIGNVEMCATCNPPSGAL